MATLVQIIYISRSTSASSRAENGPDPVVARILAKSRANNRKNGLVGVLYFGDGCFFQCLEGEESTVDALYAKLEQDPRHKDLKIISRKTIAAPSFENWSMKYVPAERSMAQLLQSKGMTAFNPYEFDQTATQEVIALLLRATEPPELDVPVGQVAATIEPVSSPAKGGASGKKMVIGAVVFLAACGLLFAALSG